MKKIVILIVVYIVIAIFISAITAKPEEIDERAMERHLQTLTESTRNDLADVFQNIPKEIVEEAEKGAADNIRKLYEYKNSFRYRFIQNLESFGLGLIAIVVPIICISCDIRWRRWRNNRKQGRYW